MKCICAISADGYMCHGPEDKMSWTGTLDKQIFQLISSLNSGICFVSKKTKKQMPKLLEGRTLIEVSRTNLTLETASKKFPNSLIVGGPTLLKAANQLGLIDDLIVNIIEDVRINKLNRDNMLEKDYLKVYSELNSYKFPFEGLLHCTKPIMTLNFHNLTTQIYRLKTL